MHIDLAAVSFAVFLPLWLVCGFSDYLCHRVSRIETTSGLKESWLHLLQIAQIGIPLTALALLEISMPVLILAVAGAVAHTLTAYWDVHYTLDHRHVSAIEQHVHGVMLTLPIVGVIVLCAGYWNILADLPEGAWNLRWRSSPLTPTQLWALFGGSLLFVVLPMAEELVRCWRMRIRKTTRISAFERTA